MIIAALSLFAAMSAARAPIVPEADEGLTLVKDPIAVVATNDTASLAGDAAVADPLTTSGIDAAVEAAIRSAASNAVEQARLEASARGSEAARLEAQAEATKLAEAALDQRRISTRVFKLAHANAEELAEKFNATWSGDFGTAWKVSKMAQAFPEANAVMVTAPRMVLDTCQRIVNEIDVESRQVYIEARFVELGNTASHKVGIDWTMLDGMTGSATIGGGIQRYNVGAGVEDYTRETKNKSLTETYKINGKNGDDGSISYFNGTLSFSQMALTLRALDATEDTKTFSNPKIIVSSGKKAIVDMTKKYPNVKVSAKRTEASGSTSIDIASNMEAIPGEDKFMFAKEAFFSWGISLEVTPRIGTNGLINVSIVPTISSLDSWVETGTSGDSDSSGTISAKYPVISVQRLISEFNLASGTTAVIGGLSVTEEEQVDNGIPLLRDIPWIGSRLFGSMVRVKRQKEIVVFVTVGFVDPRSVEKDAGLPKNAVLGRQYTKGQKLEPGDRPAKNMEGLDSLDMRPLEEQAKDPLPTQEDNSGFNFRDLNPFKKDPNYIKESNN